MRGDCVEGAAGCGRVSEVGERLYGGAEGALELFKKMSAQ